jgi:uncharacterized membrane protein
MKSFWKTVLTGLATVLPIGLTVLLIVWLVTWAESTVGGLFRLVLTDRAYVPGMGIVGGVLLLYAIGLIMGRKGIIGDIVDFGERQVERIPLVKSIYSGIRNLTRFLAMAREAKGDQRRVVMVTPAKGVRLVGFVTGTASDHLGINPDAGEEAIAVYLPMSYQVGGFTLYVPQSAVTPLDMDFETATKLVLTAGMGQGGRSHSPEEPTAEPSPDQSQPHLTKGASS